MTRPLKSVVVVGSDADAWLTALGIRRAVGGIGVEVTVAELPSRLHRHSAYVASPSLRGLHRLLGLSEQDVIRFCAVVPMLGQRYSSWSHSDPPFLLAFEPQWPIIDGLPFLQHWLKARKEGLKVALEDFSPSAVAAKQGRVPKNAAAGFQMSALDYVELVRRAAIASGIHHHRCADIQVECGCNGVTAIAIDNGVRLEGDLFIDASGPAARLAATMDPSPSVPLGPSPCDRLLEISTGRLAPLPGFSEIGAISAGWVGQFPLQDRTAVVAAYSSDHVSDEAALQEVARLCGRSIEPEGSVTPFAARVRTPWVSNVISIGSAATVLEPLDAMQLHLIHLGISNLVALWPTDPGQMPEAEIYNASMTDHVNRIVDYQIGHYRLNGRFGEPFWDEAREAGSSDLLETRMRLFQARGEALIIDRDTFEAPNWIGLFVGHGLHPNSYDPRVDLTPRQAQMESFRRHLHRIARDVQEAETIEGSLRTFKETRG